MLNLPTTISWKIPMNYDGRKMEKMWGKSEWGDGKLTDIMKPIKIIKIYCKKWS